MKPYRIAYGPSNACGRNFPQEKTATGNFNARAESYIGNSRFHSKQITITPTLPEIVLWDSSKLTDLVSSSILAPGLILSHKLKSIIEKYHPDTAQFFRMKVHHKGNVYDDYWYLHPAGDNNDLIDFSLSEIKDEKNPDKTHREKIDNYDELRQAAKAAGMSKFYHIDPYILKPQLPGFFILNFISGGLGYFVTEQLKHEIETAECTGLVFVEPNVRYP